MAEVINFNEATAAHPGVSVIPRDVNDIVGHLRAMADRIEKGDLTHIDRALFLVPVDGGWPDMWGWGPWNKAETVYLLAKALNWQTCGDRGR